MATFSYIHSVRNASPSASATNFNFTQMDVMAWNATEASMQQVIPTGGTIDYFLYVGSGAPGAGTSYTFTWRKNSANTALTAPLADAATTTSDTTNSFSVAAGDLISMQSVPANTPAALARTAWVARFTSSTQGETIILSGNSTQVTQNTTTYIAIAGDAAANATETNRESVMPTGGTLKSLYIGSDVAVAAGQTAVITLVVNGVDSALTATINGTATAGNDTSNTVAVVAGDLVSYKVVTSATSGSLRVRAGVVFVPTTDGESVQFVSSAVTLAQNLTQYKPQIGGSVSFNATEANRQTVAIACTLKKLYLNVTGVAVAQTFTGTIRANGSTTGITAVVTGLGTTANDTTHTANISDSDLISIQGITSALSGTVTPQAGLVYFTTPTGGATANSSHMMLAGMGM